MKIIQRLMETGLFGQPRQPTSEEWQLMESIINFAPTPGTQLARSSVIVEVTRGVFRLRDHHGLLAETRGVEGLVLLLMLADGEDLREKLFGPMQEGPAGVIESKPTFANLDELRARAAAMKDKMLERGSGPRGRPGQGDDHGITADDGPVRTMGLSDGIPRIE